MSNRFFNYDVPVLAGLTIRSDKYNSDFEAVEASFAQVEQALSQGGSGTGGFDLGTYNSIVTEIGSIKARVNNLEVEISEDSATLRLINDLQTNFTTQFSQANARILTVETAVSDEEMARAIAIDGLSASFTIGLNSANARIDTTQESVATETQARVSALQTLQATLETSIGVTDAKAENNITALATETQARADAITSLSATLSTDIQTVDARVDQTFTAIADETTARVTQYAELDARIDGTNGDPTAAINAAITAYNNALVAPDGAIAQQVETLETSLTNSIQSVDAKAEANITAISTEEQARIDAITNLSTSFATDVQTVDARVTDAFTAISDETTARATQYAELDARIEGVGGDPTAAINAAITAYNDVLVGPDGAIADAVDSMSLSLINSISAVDVKATNNTSAIATEEQARIDSVDSLSTSLGTAISQVDTKADNAITAVSTETQARVDAINTLSASLSSDVQDVDARVSDSFQAITDESLARAQAVSSLQSTLNNKINTVEAKADNALSAVATEEQARVDSINSLSASLGGDITAASNLAQSAQQTADDAATASAQLDTRVGTVETFTQGQIGVNSNFHSRTGALESRAYLTTSTFADGVVKVTSLVVGGQEAKIGFEGDILELKDTSGVRQLYYENGLWKFAGSIEAGATITAPFINGGTLRSARVDTIGTAYMEVHAPDGIGPDNLAWYVGPKFVDVDGNPIDGQVTIANATNWRDVNGNDSLLNRFTANYIKEGGETRVTTLNPTFETSSFESEGGNRQVVVAMTWSNRDNYFVSSGSVNNSIITDNTSGTVTISRSTNDGISWTVLTARTFQLSRTRVIDVIEDFEGDLVNESENGGGSVSFTDTESYTGDRLRYKAVVTSQQTYMGTPESQKLSIVSTEII